MEEPRTSKEHIYDTQISPLITKIIEICKEHKINMIADFSLGENLFCTTALPDLDEEDDEGVERMMRAYRVLRPRANIITLAVLTK